MLRSVQVSLSQSSWKGSAVPPQIAALRAPGGVDINVLDCLLELAYAIRPPEIVGFTLSDVWAWMRYLPALSDTQDLRLRAEWDALDAHQKTILSDDFGVGFGMRLLFNPLSIAYYADTRYVIDIITSGQYRLLRRARRGPAKAPDYMFVDANGNFGVIECKGTQSSRTALSRAMARGIRQKRNVARINGPQLVHRLVVGVFVPQYSRQEMALINIRDPEEDELGGYLESTSNEELLQAIKRVSIAKLLSLAGFGGAAYRMVDAKRQFKADQFDSEIREDRETSFRQFGIRAGEYDRPVDFLTSTEDGILVRRRLTFSVRTTESPEESISAIMFKELQMSFKSESKEYVSTFTAAGLRFELALS